MKNRFRRRCGSAIACILTPAFFALVSCVPARQPDIHEIFASSPSFHFENYAFDPESPLVSRIAEAPSFLIEYLEKIDDVDEYRSYLPDEDERAMVGAYIEKLPPLSKSSMEDRLIGIYFIEDFRGSGLMDFVLDEDGGTYAVMIVNAESLRVGISEWMTFREGTCFAPAAVEAPENDGFRILVDCGDAYAGTMYVLLHESAHVADLIHGITPYVEDSLVQLRDLHPPESTPFTERYWTNYDVPAPEYSREFMDDITFYGFGGGPKMNADDAPAIYEALAETPYVSLYACMSWAEDLAEYVTWHHWTTVLDQPYEIAVWNGSDPISAYRPMENPAVRDRADTISEVYAEK